MMLMIQGQSNDNYFSLAERMTVTSGYYFLVRFVSEFSLTETSTIPTVVSGSTFYRFHKLTITEKDDATIPEQQAAMVTLSEAGMWLYYVYQQESATNLDYTNADVLLEEGKCLVLAGTGFPVVTEYTGDPLATFYIIDFDGTKLADSNSDKLVYQ